MFSIVVSSLAIRPGQYTTCLLDSNRQPVSPMFDGLYELLPWMRANGYALSANDGPWSVRKLA